MRIIPEHKVTQFGGLFTEIKDLREIPDGYSPLSLNWLTFTDKTGIELRRGTALLGQTRQTGPGEITGLGVGTRFDGTQIPFFSYARKVKYYDSVTDDVIEVGSDMLPAGASGEDVSIFPYQNIAGAWVYLSSPNSSIYKIPVANPGSAVDQGSTNYRGFLKFGQSRSFLYNRNTSISGFYDKMGLYTSKVDKVSLSQYPSQITGESYGTGDGVTKTFTHTLASRTGVRTAFTVAVTDTNESFADDGNGGLLGTLGGSGTVNYATGAVSVTFNTAPVNSQAITCSYYYEDATSGGVADFSISNPSDRQPGEGNYFPQFDGGGLLNSVFPLSTIFYCFHELKTWQVVIPTDDGGSDTSLFVNLPFREKMGVQSHYGAFGGAAGIYLINTAEKGKSEFWQLSLYPGSSQSNVAIPKLLSKLIDFSAYQFDVAVVFEWNDFVLLSCQQIRNGTADDFNSRTFIYNKKSGLWDITDYPASVFAEYGGTLVSGDPLTNNIFTLFSGFDDDGVDIGNNYWTSGQTDLTIKGQKRFTRMVCEGLIQTPQSYAVDLSFDGADFVETFIVEGDGTYVDTGTSIAVGSNTIGSKIVGGGETVFANPYRVEFVVQSPKFTYVRIRIRALGGGYVSLSSYSYKDIREKNNRSMPVRTVV